VPVTTLHGYSGIYRWKGIVTSYRLAKFKKIRRFGTRDMKLQSPTGANVYVNLAAAISRCYQLNTHNFRCSLTNQSYTVGKLLTLASSS
jgi:hypothetical protein